MASTGIILGALLIIGMFILGVTQSMQGQLPKSTLAGAVPVVKTQQELNLCMNDCMRACVTVPGTEAECLENCNAECGA